MKTEENQPKVVHKLLAENLNALRSLGLWPETADQKDKYSYLRYLFPRIVILNCVYEIVVMRFVDIYYNADNILLICEDVLFLAVQASVMFKVTFALRHEDTLRELLTKMNKLHDSNDFEDKYQEKLLMKTKTVCDKATKFFPLIINALSVTFNILGIPRIFKTRILHFGGYHPFDVKASPNYELAVGHFMLFSAFGFHFLASADVFLGVILMHTIAQFKILNHKLNDIRKTTFDMVIKTKPSIPLREPVSKIDLHKIKMHPRETVSKIDLRKTTMDPRGTVSKMDLHKTKMYPSETVSNNDVHKAKMDAELGWSLRSEKIRQQKRSERGQKYKVKTKTVQPKIVKVGRLYQDTAEEWDIEKFMEQFDGGKVKTKTNAFAELTETDKELQVKRRVAECVAHHQALLSFANNIESLFSPMLTVQFVCILIPSGFVALYVTLAPEIDDKGMGILTTLVCAFLELFAFCLLGERVTEESTKVKDAIYDCDWFDANDEFKRSMRLMITMANQPVVISAAGYFPLSLEKFILVTKTAYSNYITLMSVTPSTNVEIAPK